jgi:hypothetical protein
MRNAIILSVLAALLLLLGLGLLLTRTGTDSRGGDASAGTGAGAQGLKAGQAADADAKRQGAAGRNSAGTGRGGARSSASSYSGAGARSARGSGEATGDGDAAVEKAAAQVSPAVMKQRAMKLLFAAATRGSPRAMWEALRDAGVTLPYEDYVKYLKDAKLRGISLDRVEGAWDGFLQFWAGKDPAAAMAWARSYQLDAGYSGPDEIFYRMVSSWGAVDPAAAKAYALGMPGFAATPRGQEVVGHLDTATNSMGRLQILTTPAAAMTPEQKRATSEALSSFYRLPDAMVGDAAKWLIANRASMDPAMWEQAMGAIAPRMKDYPVFDLIALVQSLSTTSGGRSARTGLISAIASRDPQTAMSLAGDAERDRLAVLGQWAQSNPADALKWALNQPDGADSAAYIGAVIRNADRLMRFPPIEGLATPDAATILQTVERLRAAGGPTYNEACEWAARAMLSSDPNRAFELAARSTSPTALENLLGEWTKNDPAATLAWVNSRNDSSTYATAVKSVFPEVIRRDLDAAIAWSRQLPDRAIWLEAVKELLPLTPYERWSDVLGSSPTALCEPKVASAALSGAIRLGYNDFEGSCIAVDEIMRRLAPGETDAERQSNWDQQPKTVVSDFHSAQQQLIGHLAYHDPQGALAWAEQLSWAYPPDPGSMWALQSAFRRWSSDGSGKAQEWLKTSRFSEAQRDAIATPQTAAVPVIPATVATNRLFRGVASPTTGL